jgi:DNA-binding protein HU-beta
MAKLTKTQTIAAVAEGADISKAQAKAAIDELVGLAHANARDGFTIPGLGKVSVRQTKGRNMMMRFGPDAGTEKWIDPKTKLKFTYLKAAKEAIGI